jgi:predicted TIM-barrel fold metal-dependent hydrolase
MRTVFGRITPPDPAWLARAPAEEVLDPALPLIDAHHHLWQRPDHRYFLTDYLADAATGHNLVASVFLQCHAMYRAAGREALRPVGETEFVAGIAAMSDSGQYGPSRVAAGIVGFADLTLGAAVAPVLEAHIRAGGGRFRGVRHSANWDADPTIGNGAAAPGLYLREDFRAGLRVLAARGLTLDAWSFHPQLDEVTALARAVPEATLIMGHCGGPLGYGRYAGRGEEVFAGWKAAIAELAGCPNVVMKLGGMMMRLAAFDYGTAAAPPDSAQLAALWRPWIETCIEAFGPDRCLFESNFPVEKMGIGWVALWNAFKRIAAGASADEKRALFAGTAARVYRLS